MDAVYSSITPSASVQEMALTRVFHAPRRRLFEAFTRREHLVEWWGPDGFRLTTCDLDVRTGGGLRFVLRGPDGGSYGFHGRYLEVLPPARLYFTAELEEGAGERLFTTVNFEEVDGNTWLTIRQTIPTTPGYAAGQRQGWSESLERLAAYLAAL